MPQFNLPSLVDQFQKICQESPGPIPWSFSLQGSEPEFFKCIIGSCVHGVETGSLPGILNFAQNVRSGKTQLHGHWTFFLGNPSAVEAGLRFVEEDLNRVFYPCVSGATTQSFERQRALEIMPLLQNCDLFIDFHQTMRPCLSPFYIFGFDESSYNWARLLQGSGILVTRDAGKPFAEGQMCADEYCRSLGNPAITLELGENGLNYAAETLTNTVLENLNCQISELHMALGRTPERNSPKNQPSPSEIRQAVTQRCETVADLEFYETVHKEPFRFAQQRLVKGLINFQAIALGEHLGHHDSTPINAPCNGVVLFPKYPRINEGNELLDPVGGDLFHIARKMKLHPKLAFGIKNT